MSADRARVSYDRSRQYRGLVAQQGRPTLEADVNEAQHIAEEELRHAALDVVGPAGTPDDGYAITPDTSTPPTFDFQVGKAGTNTMYVGGLRFTIDAPIVYNAQSEWLDHSTDPLWVDPTGFDGTSGSEFVYLLLQEQEVSAVEDIALRDMALGGPDTAQRLRISQRAVRLAVNADSTCSTALDQAATSWAGQGAVFDASTIALSSPALLQVTFLKPAAPSSPCDPSVAGGYLGADNQLIRVQISSFDPATKTGKIVWSFNNASFLYRVTVPDSSSVQLASTPVDSYHAPSPGGVVELLRSAVKLDASPRNENYVATHTGIFSSVISYTSDTRLVQLPAQTVPKAYSDDLTATTARPLFLRLWDAEVDFTLGQPVQLGATGVEVTLTALAQTGPFTVGEYWTFAVRPSADSVVYPQRYYDAPQPPEGPRRWVCPLGVLQRSDTALSLLEDCRKHFENLVDLTARTSGGCCTIVIGPNEFKGDFSTQLALLADAHGGTLCLKPGTYNLISPLRLGPSHAHVSIESCQPGRAIVQANPGNENQFLDGLIVITSTSDIAVSGLELVVPFAPFEAGAVIDSIAGIDAPGFLPLLSASVGIRALDVSEFLIHDCDFVFNPPQAQPTPASPPGINVNPTAHSFRAGIFASGTCLDWSLERLRFDVAQVTSAGANITQVIVVPDPADLSIGIWCGPNHVISPPSPSPTPTAAPSLVSNVNVASVDDWLLRDCVFNGCTLSTFLYGRVGTVSALDNRCEPSYAGLWFFCGGLASSADSDRSLESAIANDLALVPALVISRLYPLPSGSQPIAAAAASSTSSPPPGLPALHSALSALEFSALGQTPLPRLSLLITGNRMGAGLAHASASGIVVGLDSHGSVNSSVILSANEVLSNGRDLPGRPWAAAVVQNLPLYAIGTNVIVNQGGGASLVISPSASQTTPPPGFVAGNVLVPPWTS